MQEKFMKRVALYTGVFLMIAMSAMMYVAAKGDVIYENIRVTDEAVETKKGAEDTTKRELALEQDSTNVSHISIPMSIFVLDSNITIENSYMDKTLYITITGLEQDFYEENSLIENGDYVTKVFYEYQEDVTKIELDLNGIYEHSVVYKNNTLYIDFQNPKDLYDKVVVIDAGHGGDDYGAVYNTVVEKNITQIVADKLSEKLEANNIKAYLTRSEDKMCSEADRAKMTNEFFADMLISIHVAYDTKDSSLYGVKTLYNEDYVIPGFGNVELANCLELQLAKTCNTNACGLFAASKENELISLLSIPAAQVEIGYLSNDTELILLQSDEYLNLVAEGLCSGILEAYSLKEKE